MLTQPEITELNEQIAYFNQMVRLHSVSHVTKIKLSPILLTDNWFNQSNRIKDNLVSLNTFKEQISQEYTEAIDARYSIQGAISYHRKQNTFNGTIKACLLERIDLSKVKKQLKNTSVLLKEINLIYRHLYIKGNHFD